MDFSLGAGAARPSRGPQRRQAQVTPAAQSAPARGGPGTDGWLMTAVAPFGENEEDAFDQALVELGLGDARLIQVQGAMLPLGFEPAPPRDLPMGSLVECHMAVGHAQNGSTAVAGVAWAMCETPEGDECAVVATIATNDDLEETELMLRRNLKRRLASRDLEVVKFDSAVDEVTAAADMHGVVIAALILPDSLRFTSQAPTGPTRNRMASGVSSIGGSLGGPSGLGGSPGGDFSF